MSKQELWIQLTKIIIFVVAFVVLVVILLKK